MDILFEDNHLLIINKRPGELSQLDKTGDNSVLEKYKLYLKKKHNKKGNVFLGLVNRLDRPTSGVLILAKTSKALSRMNKMLVEKKILKKYLAIVEKKPIRKKNTLINFLKKNKKDLSRYIILGHTDTKGSENYNLNLSFERAEAVKNILLNQGVFEKDITVLGKGENDLAITTPDDTKHPANRRAEVKILN